MEGHRGQMQQGGNYSGHTDWYLIPYVQLSVALLQANASNEGMITMVDACMHLC